MIYKLCLSQTRDANYFRVKNEAYCKKFKCIKKNNERFENTE